MADEEMLAAIQQAARRWALDRGAYWAAQMASAIDEERLSPLVRELASQGWLPESPEEWGDASAITLVRLGRTLAHEVPAAFMPILAHWLGMQLLAPVLGRRSPVDAGPIAASPYVDYSRSSSSLAAVPSEGGWVLHGQAVWVVNAHPACRLVVTANLPRGVPGIFDVDAAQVGCYLGEPLSLLGLWGVPVRHVRLSSARLHSESLVAEGSRAVTLLTEGYRVARWAVLGLLCGALECMYRHASAYAETRTQGGRKIVGHGPVRELLHNARVTIDWLGLLIERFERDPRAEYAGGQIMRLARRACDGALQVFGGIGYVCPGVPERCWRDVHQAATLCSGLATDRVD